MGTDSFPIDVCVLISRMDDRRGVDVRSFIKDDKRFSRTKATEDLESIEHLLDGWGS